MALSSSESELLTETCENMNVAANTCREVLEMLRSLGNTGVVDIATHNNASSAHAAAENLFQLSSGSAVLGSAGWTGISAYSSLHSFKLEKDSTHKGYNMSFVRATNGSTSSTGVAYYNKVGVSNSSGTLLTEAQMLSSGYYRQMSMGSINWEAKTSDKEAKVCINARVGKFDEQSHPMSGSCLQLQLNDVSSGSFVIAYEINTRAILPWDGVTAALGSSGFPFDTAYFRTAATTTSDRREKSSISAIGSEAVEFIKSLRPVQFTVKNGKQNVLEADENGYPTNIETIPGTRRHWGLIAQEVQEALVSAGYDPSACAVWSLADKDDPDSRQALRYEELIAPMIKVIQQQQERIEDLERKVA